MSEGESGKKEFQGLIIALDGCPFHISSYYAKYYKVNQRADYDVDIGSSWIMRFGRPVVDKSEWLDSPVSQDEIIQIGNGRIY